MRALAVVLCVLLAAVAMTAGTASAANDDAAQDESLVLAPGAGTIMGYVDDGIRSVPNATVELVGSDAKSASTDASTDIRGLYTLESVAPGTYYAIARKSGYNATYTSTFNVTEGGTAWVNITMREQLTWLTGRVTYSGSPLNEVQVTLESASGAKFTNYTGEDGRYSIRVPAGEYVIIYSKGGYVDQQISKVLLPVQENTEDVVLKRSSLPGNTGFIHDYDLPHSMMIVGLFLAVVTLVLALVLRVRVVTKPELLSRSNDEEK